MTQYNTLNVKLSNSQLSKLKSGLKHGTKVTLSFSSNVVGGSNDETSFLHKWLLTNTQVSRFPKAFANCSSASLRLLKTQLSKLLQLEGFGPYFDFSKFQKINIFSSKINRNFNSKFGKTYIC